MDEPIRPETEKQNGQQASQALPGQHAPVDPAKGNALLKKLLGTRLPIIQEPEQPS